MDAHWEAIHQGLTASWRDTKLRSPIIQIPEIWVERYGLNPINTSLWLNPRPKPRWVHRLACTGFLEAAWSEELGRVDALLFIQYQTPPPILWYPDPHGAVRPAYLKLIQIGFDTCYWGAYELQRGPPPRHWADHIPRSRENNSLLAVAALFDVGQTFWGACERSDVLLRLLHIAADNCPESWGAVWRQAKESTLGDRTGEENADAIRNICPRVPIWRNW